MRCPPPHVGLFDTIRLSNKTNMYYPQKRKTNRPDQQDRLIKHLSMVEQRRQKAIRAAMALDLMLELA